MIPAVVVCHIQDRDISGVSMASCVHGVFISYDLSQGSVAYYFFELLVFLGLRIDVISHCNMLWTNGHFF